MKYLLERTAPVMIDAQSLSVLVEHIDDAVKGQGTIADGIVNAGEKGVQLLLVSQELQIRWGLDRAPDRRGY